MVGLDLIDLPMYQRMGLLAAFDSWDQFIKHWKELLEIFSLDVCLEQSLSDTDMRASVSDTECEEPIHIVNVALKISSDFSSPTDRILSELFQNFCTENKMPLLEKSIRRITFVCLEKRQFPKYFTYRSRNGFEEDRIYRHLEPALAFQLEINRMKHFVLQAIPTNNQKMHLYLGSAKVGSGDNAVTDHRFFLRCIIRHSDLISKEASFEYMRNEGERILLEAMDELEVAFDLPDARKTDCNHIFLTFVPCVTLDPLRVVDTVRDTVMRYGPRLWKLRVLQAELKYAVRLSPSGPPIQMRLTVSNESGYYLDLSLYQEIVDKETGQVIFECWQNTKPGPLHGFPVSTPYQTKNHMQQKRYLAQKSGTTYVYDFPEMFRQALIRLWKEYNVQRGGNVDSEPNSVEILQCVELCLDESGNLRKISRFPGENDCGMVAWLITLRTPEYPEGRDIIVIANDITYYIGSFAVPEDLLFLKASEYARHLGVPRIYLAINSGARLGLAEEIKNCYKVAWEDPEVPEKGFKYLYLTPEDYKRANALSSTVNAKLIEDGGETRYKIVDVIGKENCIGVENLKGSGMIAGETSQAYNEIVTISLVSCRTVGIGAYLVRLGQRTVQVENSHIILTGAPALNKLLGREVYASNNQLGGVQIMHNNGVSHAVAHSDFDGVMLILRWLSYMPKDRKSPIPIINAVDPVDRDIEFCPTRNPYDPRWMIAGRPNIVNNNLYESGFFDKDSWIEAFSVNLLYCIADLKNCFDRLWLVGLKLSFVVEQGLEVFLVRL